MSEGKPASARRCQTRRSDGRAPQLATHPAGLALVRRVRARRVARVRVPPRFVPGQARKIAADHQQKPPDQAKGAAVLGRLQRNSTRRFARREGAEKPRHDTRPAARRRQTGSAEAVSGDVVGTRRVDDGKAHVGDSNRRHASGCRSTPRSQRLTKAKRQVTRGPSPQRHQRAPAPSRGDGSRKGPITQEGQPGGAADGQAGIPVPGRVQGPTAAR